MPVLYDSFINSDNNGLMISFINLSKVTDISSYPDAFLESKFEIILEISWAVVLFSIIELG